LSWDDLIGLKPDVPFLELPSFKHEEEPLENRTHEFLRRLFPSKKRILKQFGDGKNHWIQRQVIVYGGPGTGKTEFFKWIVLKAVEKYGRENVKAYMARGDLEALLNVEYPSKPVILIYDDDATLEKLNKKTVKVFTRIRHKCMDDTGLDSGLAVTVTGLHRFHASNPLIRTNFNLLVVRNPPAGKYDHDFIKFYIGPEGLHYLEKVNELRMKNESYLGHAVFANPSSGIRGVLTNVLVQEDLLKDVLEILEGAGKAEAQERKEDVDLAGSGPADRVEREMDQEAFINACIRHFGDVEKKYPDIRDLRETLDFWADMMLNIQSFGDTGRRTTMWRKVQRYSEQIGEAVEYAWGDFNPDYVHIAGNGRVDYMKKDGSEWVEIKWRSKDFSWKPRLDNLSKEARQLLERGIPGRCIVFSYKPRLNQHTVNRIIMRVFKFAAASSETTPPSPGGDVSPRSRRKPAFYT